MMHSFRNNNNFRTKAVCAVAILAMAVSAPAIEWLPGFLNGTVEVLATAEHEQKRDEAQNNLNDTNDKIDDVKDAQGDLEDQLSEAQSKRRKLEQKIDATNEELNTTKQELEDLCSQIEDKQAEIEQAAADLVVAQDTLDEEYEAMKLRIQFMYENKQQESFWTAILEADGLADMLTRVEYIADVYASDRKLMDKYKTSLQEVEDLNTQLAQEMADLVALQGEAEEKQSSLESKLASLKADEDELAAMISDIKDQKRTYATQLASLEDMRD